MVSACTARSVVAVMSMLSSSKVMVLHWTLVMQNDDALGGMTLWYAVMARWCAS